MPAMFPGAYSSIQHHCMYHTKPLRRLPGGASKDRQSIWPLRRGILILVRSDKVLYLFQQLPGSSISLNDTAS